MAHPLRRGLGLLASLSFIMSVLAPLTALPAVAQEPTTTLIVQLKQPAVAAAQHAARSAGRSFDAGAYRATLTAAQDAFLRDLTARGVVATVVTIDSGVNGAAAGTPVQARWTNVLNGVAIKTVPSAQTAIRGMPGVKRVEPEKPVRALLAESVPYVRAPETWNAYRSAEGDRAQGQGQIIADIDTGIDWTHPAFTDNPADPPGPLHRKVKYYATYTGGVIDDYGHGTHVGATIAGDKSLGYKLGVSQPTDDLSESRFDGVAPKADLWGYKVLAASGNGVNTSIITAIEDAFTRGAHIMNLSLGSTDDSPYDAEAMAVNNAMLGGVVMAVAAGNEGPGYRTIGTPATAFLPITVGASTDPGDNQYYVEHHGAGATRRLRANPFPNTPAPPRDPVIDSPYTFVGIGCSPADYAGKTPVTGRVALIERGVCTFTAKAVLAQSLGARAAIIFNNEPGALSGSMEQTQIPVSALSQQDGQYLRGFTDGVTGDSGASAVRLDPVPDVISGQITGFSSRGPTGDYRIKPDVVAPGNTVLAATTKVGAPTASMQNTSGYTSAGGTSMATPHVAGAAALLRQIHPTWSSFDIKNALMNTARILVDPKDEKPYSVTDQGAGLIDIHAAASTKGILTAANKFPLEDGDDAEPDSLGAEIASYSFGEVENFGGRVTRTASFTIKDVSGSGRTYALAFQPGAGKDRGGWGRTLPANGFSATVKPERVTVPAGGSATFTLTVSVDGALLQDGDYEGRIVATAPDQTLRAPVFYRNVHRQSVPGTSAPVLDDPTADGETLPNGTFTLDWSTLRGADRYRLQEATQINELLNDNGDRGFESGTFTAKGQTCNSILVGACEENPMGGWISTDLRRHGPSGKSFHSLQAKDQDNSLQLTKPVTVPAGSATLSYWTWFDIEPGYDYGYVEASRDGTNWAKLESLTGRSDEFEGAQDGWVRRTVDLSPFAGGQLHLRFHYVTDMLQDTGLFEGWYVDDVALHTANWQTLAEPRQSDFRVTGKAAGTYYYRVAGLFNTSDATRAMSPWSNTADVAVRVAATPTPRPNTPGTSTGTSTGTTAPNPGQTVTGTVDTVTGTVDTVTSEVDKAQEGATGAVNGAVQDGAKTVGDTVPAASGAANQGASTVTGATSSAPPAGSTAGSAAGTATGAATGTVGTATGTATGSASGTVTDATSTMTTPSATATAP